MNRRRRHFMAGAGALAATGLIASRAAQAAAWNKAGFESKAVNDTLKNLGAAGAAESRDIVITAPDIAENGAVVPVGAATTLPNVKRMLVLVEKNPNVLSAIFDVNESVEPNFTTRVKMGQSSNVYAVALTNDGKALYAVKEIKVTLGGCGG